MQFAQVKSLILNGTLPADLPY